MPKSKVPSPGPPGAPPEAARGGDHGKGGGAGASPFTGKNTAEALIVMN